MSTKTYTATLSIIECADCHMDFGTTPQFQSDRRDDHRTFYCPAGHHNHYPQQSTEERLRRELAAAEGKAASERAKAKTAENRRRAAKGQLTKAKKRIVNGVCPCCNRHFENVERHMTSKHPDYAETRLPIS